MCFDKNFEIFNIFIFLSKVLKNEPKTKKLNIFSLRIKIFSIFSFFYKIYYYKLSKNLII